MNRLVTALTAHPLVALRVAHQARLARIVERRLELGLTRTGVLADVAAAWLHIGRRMAVRAVRLTRRQPVIPAVGRRAEGYGNRRAAVTLAVQHRLGRRHAVRGGAEVEDAHREVSIGIRGAEGLSTPHLDGREVGIGNRRIPDRMGEITQRVGVGRIHPGNRLRLAHRPPPRPPPTASTARAGWWCRCC